MDRRADTWAAIKSKTPTVRPWPMSTRARHGLSRHRECADDGRGATHRQQYREAANVAQTQRSIATLRLGIPRQLSVTSYGQRQRIFLSSLRAFIVRHIPALSQSGWLVAFSHSLGACACLRCRRLLLAVSRRSVSRARVLCFLRFGSE